MILPLDWLLPERQDDGGKMMTSPGACAPAVAEPTACGRPTGSVDFREAASGDRAANAERLTPSAGLGAGWNRTVSSRAGFDGSGNGMGSGGAGGRWRRFRGRRVFSAF